MSNMKMVVTAKLKLYTTPEQLQALRAIQLMYRESLNFVSRYAFAHGKLSNKVALQEGTYDELRARFHLPSQMACSVPRQVGATYKGLWKKVKDNAAHRRAGVTKKRYQGLDKPPRYISPTLTYQYGKDYSFKTQQRVSVLTLEGRIIVPYTGYDKHAALLRQGAEIGTALLWYNKARRQFYLLVSLTIEVADPVPETHVTVVGVDVGVRYLAVTSDTQGTCSFYPGKQVAAKANHYARLRKRLQQKGTRSATRRLVALSGRERRLKASANHQVSKRIATHAPHSLIGLEDLTHIRDRTRRKKGKRATSKQRKANAVRSKWSFAELHAMISYKSLLRSSMAIKVDAHYSSQACPRCGHTDPNNRPHKGLLFVCQHCRYTLHADLVGARNITLRTLLARQDWASTGFLSVTPDVSDVKTKAVRLRRYAELRWSLDTSPAPFGLGD